MLASALRSLPTALAVTALAAGSFALGCGGGDAAPSMSHPDAGTHTGMDAGTDAGRDAGPPSVPPIEAVDEQWTWVDVDGAFCADGSPTGLAVNLSDKSPNVVIFLMGGGACWDYDSCYQSQLATNVTSGFSEANMPFLTLMTSAVGLLNRTDPTNPFHADSVISVPYCTGDAFTGDNVADYQGKKTHHVGHANVMAYLKRIVPTFPNAKRVVVVGVSAGGIGAAFNWWYVQQAFGPGVTVDLVDDSGPPLPAPYLMSSVLSKWQNAWHLEQNLPPGCTECKTTLDALITYAANESPKSRGALLDYTQDSVLPGFLDISTQQFGEGIDALAKQRLDALPSFRYFFVDQSDHVLLPHPDLSQNGVNLWDWIKAMFADDPSWVNVQP